MIIYMGEGCEPQCTGSVQTRMFPPPLHLTVLVTLFSPTALLFFTCAQRAGVYPIVDSCSGHRPGEMSQKKEVLRGRDVQRSSEEKGVGVGGWEEEVEGWHSLNSQSAGH